MNGDPVASDVAPTATAAVSQAKTDARQDARQTDSLVDEAVRVANTLNDKLPTLPQESHAADNHKAARQQQQQEPKEESKASGAHPVQPPEREEKVSAAKITTAVPQGETRGRLPKRAASVGGNLGPRVEKLREASTIVFDEASDDPGLRFVIVSVVLFVLFLFILLFSYILG
jgi:cobalamin biosynthesis Mg chelatase CobN